jgi:hypothetical protein
MKKKIISEWIDIEIDSNRYSQYKEFSLLVFYLRNSEIYIKLIIL